MTNTYSTLYLDVRRRLRQADLPGADLAARELVCFGAGKPRDSLARDGGLYVSQEVENRVWELVERHLDGEPVAYIIGEWDFYGLTLDVSRDTLIPRPDTEVLAKQAIRYLRTLEKQHCRALDLCAGCGCVGLAVASQVPWARVVLGELSEPALRLCHKNTFRCNLTARVVATRTDARKDPEKNLGRFHCIVCNPPYIPTAEIEGLDRSVRDFEPRLALDGGRDGLDFFRLVADRWRTALYPGGMLYFEVGIGQADPVMEIMEYNEFLDIHVLQDTNGIPRVVYGALSPAYEPPVFDDEEEEEPPSRRAGTGKPNIVTGGETSWQENARRWYRPAPPRINSAP